MIVRDIREDSIKQLPEFNGHRRVVKVQDDSVGLLGFIAIHSKRGNFPSLGATRFWKYDEPINALRDALRLSRLMSYKSVLAGLPYGGAKAVLLQTPLGLEKRKDFFRVYVEKVNRLQGEFITGSDVGVDDEDLEIMLGNSDYIIGKNVSSGYFTAQGVLVSIKFLLEKVYGSKEIKSKTFAVQGLGKTGFPLIEFLHKEGADHIYIADINKQKISLIKEKFTNISVVRPEEIHKQKVDIFCPCALSYIINKNTLDELNCKGIAGSANNQLESPSLAYALHKKNIYYAPDYIANSGGLISVVDQYKNVSPDEDRIKKEVSRVENRLHHAYSLGEEFSLPISVVADGLAEKIIKEG